MVTYRATAVGFAHSFLNDFTGSAPAAFRVLKVTVRRAIEMTAIAPDAKSMTCKPALYVNAWIQALVAK